MLHYLNYRNLKHLMVTRLSQLAAGAALLLVAGCGGGANLEEASASITAQGLSAQIKILSSDAFEGRGPATPGGKRTTDYLQEQFAALGLSPGNGDSYLQEVPLVQITTRHVVPLTFTGGGRTVKARPGVDYIARSESLTKSMALDASQVVFVGYGIVAPEFGWDDYAGLDAAGKTVVALVNDPGYASQDPDLFTGNAMTYYGRWTYKFEEAARQGARAMLVIHETGPAGYPWQVIGGGASRPYSVLASKGGEPSRPPVQGWITDDLARRVFAHAGADFDALKAQALSPDFRPVPLELTTTLTLESSFDYSSANNVLGLLPGSKRPDEIIIYMAHWDHLGMDTGLEGDQIFNGALDNATGTAALLQLAGAFQALGTPPARSILFLATTAEEQGLLGSLYYGTHPVYPLNKTVGAVNIDGLNIYGKMNDIIVVGHGNSELDEYAADAAADQGRHIVPDPLPEKGYFFRSDHFSLAKQGVPALYFDNGVDHVEHGREWTLARMDNYTAERYHKVGDEFDPDWDLTGAVDDIRLFFALGHRLASESTFPNWYEGNAFRAARDKMMMSPATRY